MSACIDVCRAFHPICFRSETGAVPLICGIDIQRWPKMVDLLEIPCRCIRKPMIARYPECEALLVK